MAKRTEKMPAARTALQRRIPPARPMPVFSARPRTPGFITAKTVGSFVPGLAKKAFEKYGFSTASLITDWDRIVGPQIAAYTEPQRLKWPHLPGGAVPAAEEGSARPGATLVLKVDPARALDAEYAGRQIVDRVNTYFGYRAVAQLRLVQAPVKMAATPPAAPRRTPAAPAPVAEGALGAALARMAAGVEARKVTKT
jgi:hypothetical protein